MRSYFLRNAVLLFVVLISINAKGQNGNLHRDLQYFYSDYYGKLDTTFTSAKNSSTSFLLDTNYQALIQDLKYTKATSWVGRRAVNESWIHIKEKKFQFTCDPYFNLGRSKETVIGKNLWTNKRGAFFNGQFGKRIKIHSFVSEGSFLPEPFLDQSISKSRITPGEGETKFIGNYYDNTNSFGAIEIKANSFMDITLGHGKNFLGEGYRSLFLSDASRSYPYGRLDFTLGKYAKYTAIVGEFLNYTPDMPAVGDVLRQKKYGSFHYLETRLGKKVFLSLFESVIWGGDSLARSSFDINYVNPFVIMRPIEYGLGSPDNMQLGIGSKYIPTSYLTLYGQFLLTEYYAKELFGGNNWWGNKFAFQVGTKLHNLPFAKNLFVQIEYNQIRPYTYNHRYVLSSYSNAGQPLAHPSGSNLKELTAIANYRYKRWSVNMQSVYKLSGLEKTDSTSIGTDVLRSYNLRENEYNNVIGQGISYQQLHNSAKISYLINPSNMVFIEAGIINRYEIIGGTAQSSNVIFIGLRTGISNFYYDF